MTTVTADWNDVDAALETAASKNEMAVVSSRVNEPRERIIELRTAGDEPVELVVRRDKWFPVVSPERVPSQGITLSARVGRFGDPEREARLLGDLADRLQQLAGVSWAPIQ